MQAARNTVWTLVDQGAISLGAFATNILLARHLSQPEYGIFGILLGVLLFSNGVHSSLVSYPLSVKASVEDSGGAARSSSVSLLLTLLLSLPLGAGVVLAAALIGRPGLALPAAAALLLWQVQETLRRSLMATLRHRDALWGDALSYLGQAGLLWLVCSERQVNLGMVFGLMALTSGAAAAFQAGQVKLRVASFLEICRQGRRSWRLGRLVLASSVLNLLTINSFFWVLAFLFGPAKTGSLQAAVNLLGVSHPVLFSMGNVIVPQACRASLSGGRKAAWRHTVKHSAHCALLMVPYFLLLMAWPRGILQAFYGGQSPYLSLSPAVRLLVPAYALAFLGQAFKAFLASMEETGVIFRAQLSAAGASLAAGMPLTAWLGVNGACIGMSVVNFLSVAVSARGIAERKEQPAPAQLDVLPQATGS